MAAPYWLGVDLGGTKILAGLFDRDFSPVGRAKQPTNYDEGGPAVFPQRRFETRVRDGKVEIRAAREA